MNKRFLVTGGCGFIGSAFVRAALKNGDQVFNIDGRFEGAVDDAKRYWDSDPAIKNLFDDVNHSDVLSALNSFRPDYLVHFVAESHVDRSINGPRNTYRNNLDTTLTLLEHLSMSDVAGNCVFVFISTDEVFGDLGCTGLFNEQSTIKPSSPYSASKAAAELAVSAWSRTFGTKYIITNCSNNFGEYQHKSKLIPKFISCVTRGETFPLYGSGTNVRDWLYVEDHISALFSIFEHNDLNSRWCIGANMELSNTELLRRTLAVISSLTDKELTFEDTVEFVADRPGHDRRYAVDCSKLLSIGWKPMHGFDQALTRTVEWYLGMAHEV